VRLLFVVQRYGSDVAGGAEALCRMMATRLVGRGHEVTVVTSCARAYDTWIDHYPAGESVEDGVRVLRLPVAAPRDAARFAAVSERVAPGRSSCALVEHAWMIEQGPWLRELASTLRSEARHHDVADFYTYLYATSWFGLHELRGEAPAILHPAAHVEWPLRLPIVRAVFDRADALVCSTPEELDLVRRRFRPAIPAAVVGIGFDPPAREPDVAAFRHRFDLGDRPYLLYLGRIDPNKGADEAIRFAQAYRRRHGSDLPLVLCGAQMMPIDDLDGLVLTGFVDDDARWAALAGAAVLLQPSRQESFGMTIAEAWTVGRPALVHEGCDVTAGLVRRSGGGLSYTTSSEFDAATAELLGDPALGDRLGELGRRHVEQHHTWPAVLDAYESLVERMVGSSS
jgi:glycosyltransferase involved in cell wall biosynthesis